MYPYRDQNLSASLRANDLLRRMSLREKVGQLCKLDGFCCYDRIGDGIVIKQSFKDTFKETPIGSMYGLTRADWWTRRDWETGIVPRLMSESVNAVQNYVVTHSSWGIPLILAEEAPHGLMTLGGTVFPTGLGLGSTWNQKLIKKIGDVINSEASAVGVHTVYGPILDIPHDPRWSRNEESFSEDPLLTTKLGIAYVEGLQGGHFPTKGRAFSTLKHLAGHGDPEGGHNSAPSHIGPIEFRNIQFRPFEACIRAGARSMMCAYHTIDGIPCAGNHDLLTGIVREECGFEGFIVSDRGAIPNLLAHRFAADQAEACALALKAGLDTDEGCLEFYSKGLEEALNRGLIDISDIDQAVGRVLELKFRLGLFEHPYRRTGDPVEILGCDQHRNTALVAARESLVLLTNKNNLLPLTKVRSLAVLGPNADEPMNQLGDYTAPQRSDDVITVRGGLERLGAMRGLTIHYAKGCGVRSLKSDGIPEALRAAGAADVSVLVLGGSSAWSKDVGALPNGAAQAAAQREDLEIDKESGEGFDRASLRLGGLQIELLKKLKAAGKKVVVVLIMGRPLIINEILEIADAVLLAWYPGMMGGQAVAEALLGLYNPGGRLPISFARDEGQLPVYYNTHLPRGNYIDLDGSPQLSFGFGLSYTKVRYSAPRLSSSILRLGKRAEVSVTVTNTGVLPGDEVVQMYLTDQVASIARPFRELRGFRRIHLNAGDSMEVTFPLGGRRTRFHQSTSAIRRGAWQVYGRSRW